MTRRCRVGFISITSLISLLLPRMVHAEWIALSPANLLPGDPSDLQWLAVSLPVAPGEAIDAVELCYQAPDAGTFIRQVRLIEKQSDYGLVVHDDGTILKSPTAACYRSHVADCTAVDAMSLCLRLEFAEVDDVILIDTVSIHVP